MGRAALPARDLSELRRRVDGGAAETVSKLVRRSILLPLLREVEERAGERRGVFIGNSPLLNPLPARSSRGEEEAKLSFETVSAARPYRLGNVPIIIGKWYYSGSAIRLVESPEFPGALRRLKECVKNLRMDKSGREWPDFCSSDHEL